jgi:dynein heavy chain
MHLKPLRRQIEVLEECEFLGLEKRIPALYHVICLIWANTTHYQKPARLVVLMQEITNFMLELVRKVLLG